MVLFLQGEPAPILQGFFKLRVASVPGRLAFYDESGDEFLLHWKSWSIWPTGGEICLIASGKIGKGG